MKAPSLIFLLQASEPRVNSEFSITSELLGEKNRVHHRAQDGLLNFFFSIIKTNFEPFVCAQTYHAFKDW